MGKPRDASESRSLPKLSQESLVSWMRFAQYRERELPEASGSSLRSLLLALRNLFRHAAARTLADFEPRRNKVMQDLLKTAYADPDRKIRILAA